MAAICRGWLLQDGCYQRMAADGCYGSSATEDGCYIRMAAIDDGCYMAAMADIDDGCYRGCCYSRMDAIEDVCYRGWLL